MRKTCIWRTRELHADSLQPPSKIRMRSRYTGSVIEEECGAVPLPQPCGARLERLVCITLFFFHPRGKQAQPLNFPRLLNDELSRLTLARQGSTAPVGASLDALGCATMRDDARLCRRADWF